MALVTKVVAMASSSSRQIALILTTHKKDRRSLDCMLPTMLRWILPTMLMALATCEVLAANTDSTTLDNLLDDLAVKAVHWNDNKRHDCTEAHVEIVQNHISQEFVAAGYPEPAFGPNRRLIYDEEECDEICGNLSDYECFHYITPHCGSSSRRELVEFEGYGGDWFAEYHSLEYECHERQMILELAMFLASFDIAEEGDCKKYLEGPWKSSCLFCPDNLVF